MRIIQIVQNAVESVKKLSGILFSAVLGTRSTSHPIVRMFPDFVKG